MKVLCIDGDCWWPEDHPEYLGIYTVTGEQDGGYYLAEFPNHYPYRWAKCKFIKLPDLQEEQEDWPERNTEKRKLQTI